MLRVMPLLGQPVADWHRNPRSLWIDVERPTEAELADLQRVLRFNPLALEDALTKGQWSRFEVYAEHVFLVFRTLDEPVACTDDTERVSLFWYPETDTLVTLRLRPVAYLEHTWAELEPLSHGIEERVIHTLLARGSGTFFEFTDALAERIDALEERMFSSNGSASLAKEVFAYKHLISTVRRLASNARESVAAFSRHALVVTNTGSGVLDEGVVRVNPDAQEVATYFRDVADTLARVYETLDSAREVLSNILDVNVSLQQGRSNEVMKTLTTVSTVFLPLTFLAGLWGMNFEFEPEFGWRYGYAFAWASFLLVGGGLAWFFKRRGWW